MSFKTAYPRTSEAAVDVVSAEGAVCVSCKAVGGRITPALTTGLSSNRTPANVICAAYSEATGRYYLLADGKAYNSRSSQLISSSFANITLSSPFIYDDRSDGTAKTYIISGDKGLAYPSTLTPVTLKYGIYAGVLKSGRLFAVDNTNKFKLRWSGKGGGFDWEESISGAGWANLDPGLGAVRNLVVLGEKLIALRELGITVISAFGNPENFKSEERNISAPSAISNTAAVVCGKLYFFTFNGFYGFDGSKTFKVDCPLADSISSPKNAVNFGETYLICGVHKPENKKCVFAYDTREGAAYIIDCPATALIANSDIIAYKEEGGSSKLENGNEFTFTSGKLDFGTGGKKVLKRIEILSGGEADITVSNGEYTRTYSGVKDKIITRISGVSFTIKVEGAQEIKSVKAFAEVRSGI